MRIDFLIGDNPYATTSHFSEKFAEALRRSGAEVRLFYVGGGNFYKAFYAITDDPPDLTCSFSDITLGEKEPLGCAWRIPHLTMCVDHALYFLHQTKSNYSYLSTIDEEDLNFLNQLGFQKAFFLPHGVDRELAKIENEKVYDIAMLSSCIDFEKIRKGWPGKYPQIHKILEEASERVLEEGISCLNALLDLKIVEGLPLYHQEVENYVRGVDRVNLVQALDCPRLHIWGHGNWRRYVKEAKVHRAVSFDLGLQVMSRSKIVLNSAPTLQYGSHERIFHALILGALPMTSDTHYVRKYFSPGENISVYRMRHVKERVDHYLGDDKARIAMTDLGREEVLRNHTWDERAGRLTNFCADLAKCPKN